MSPVCDVYFFKRKKNIMTSRYVRLEKCDTEPVNDVSTRYKSNVRISVIRYYVKLQKHVCIPYKVQQFYRIYTDCCFSYPSFYVRKRYMYSCIIRMMCIVVR